MEKFIEKLEKLKRKVFNSFREFILLLRNFSFFFHVNEKTFFMWRKIALPLLCMAEVFFLSRRMKVDDTHIQRHNLLQHKG
jgi:hypothetical protein